MSDDEIYIINDGAGVAAIGDPELVDSFLTEVDTFKTTGVPIGRLNSLIALFSAAADTTSLKAANSGRWLKLDEASSAALRKYGKSFNEKNGLMYGVVRAEKGEIAKHLQFVPSSSSLFSPASFQVVAGVMTQISMEQQMSEIRGYLESINKKLDLVVQDLRDSLFAELEGATDTIAKAMISSEKNGHVNEVTWSQVQGLQESIFRVQFKVISKIGRITDDLARNSTVGSRLETLKLAELELTDMLGALAQTFRLQDSFIVLELDRVMETEPEDLESHRHSLEEVREKRIDIVVGVTSGLLDRIQKAGTVSNAEKIRSAIKSDRLIKRCNGAALDVLELQKALGLLPEANVLEGQTWWGALRGFRDETLEATKHQAGEVRALSKRALERKNEYEFERAKKKYEKLVAQRLDPAQRTAEIEADAERSE